MNASNAQSKVSPGTHVSAAPLAAFVRDSIGQTQIVHVLGEIDLSNAPELEAEIAQLEGPGNVIVDLTGCTYVDSTGLGIIATAQKRLNDRLRLVVPNGPLLRIFDICGLVPHLNPVPTLEEALA